MNYREPPEISENLKQIVDLVFQYRFINRHQFSKLFGHKDPSRINKWLKELVDKKYLGRIYSKKLLENTKPAIYYLGNNGIIWARWKKSYDNGSEPIPFNQLKKFYQDKNASESFINHCITLFDIYLQYKGNKKPKRNNEEDMENWFTAKTEIWLDKRHYMKDEEGFNEIKDLIPDAYIANSQVSKKKVEEQIFFIVLFDPHVPRYAIRYKINKYIEFFDGDEHKCDDIINYGDMKPIFLMIFPSHQKANQMGKYIKKQLEENYVTDLVFQTTTTQKILAEGLYGGEKTWRIIGAN